jgi:hypothetical protein
MRPATLAEILSGSIVVPNTDQEGVKTAYGRKATLVTKTCLNRKEADFNARRESDQME